MSVRDLLRILRRNLIIVAVCLVAGAALGGWAAVKQSSDYVTHTRLFVSSNGSDSTDSLLQNSNLVLDRVPSYATLVNSPLVLTQVAQRLGRTESVEAMAGRIQATNPLQTALIEITVRDTTPRRAYELATAVSAVMTSVVPRLESSAGGFAPIKITIVSQAEFPARADLSPAGSRLALGILLGLLLGTAIAIGRELVDARLEDPEQLRAKLNLAPLGVLAGSGGGNQALLPPDDAYWASQSGEGYRQLRANLRVLVASGGLRSVLVTGPHADDGAATVAQNLAIALSMAKVRVLLIEADLRHPRLAATFAIGVTGNEPAGNEPAGDEPTGDEPAGDESAGDEPAGDDEPAGELVAGDGGLSAVLAGDTDLDAAIHSRRDGMLNLLPAGTGAGGSGELLASDEMPNLLGRLEQRFDLLIISAPPMLEVADTAVLAAQVDGVLLTSRCGGTRWTAVRQSVQALYDARARVLGAAVLGKTRGAGRASRAALPAPVGVTPWPEPTGDLAAARATDEPRRVTVSTRLVRRPLRRLAAPPQSPATAPRQLTPARGVAAVKRTVEAPANNRTPNNRADNPTENGKWS
jgi:capsular polysaccharide biosynthesis protein/Mrp family chromosome partitioning ATPase